MSTTCSDLQSFLDGALAPAEARAFEAHLSGCAACQAETESAMQCFALGAELARRPDRPRAILPEGVAAPVDELGRARRRRVVAAVTLAAAAAAAATLLVALRPRRE